MKLLLDENLSHKLPEQLSDLFPHSTHVRNVGLRSSDDPLVWQFARDNDFVLISKDADMHDRSLVFGFPPKIIRIRLGNCTTPAIEDLVRREFDKTNEFLDDDYASFLALSK